jgi:transposase
MLEEARLSDKMFIGVDVSAEWIDIAFHGGGTVERIANEAGAIAAWLARLKPDEVALVAFEPTGGYELILRGELVAARLQFVRVHPNELAAFRSRRGVKAKTDPIDARLLADFAALELAGRGLAPLVEGDEVLREMSARRRQLVDLLHAERCRADRAQAPAVREGLEAVIVVLKQTLDSLEQTIEAHIAEQPALAATAGCLRSLTGVGPITVQTLMGELPELGRLTGKEIRPRRPGPPDQQERQAHPARHHRPWPARRQARALQRRQVRHPLEPGDAGLLPKPRPSQSPAGQGRPHRRHAKNARHPQRHRPRPAALEPRSPLTAITEGRRDCRPAMTESGDAARGAQRDRSGALRPRRSFINRRRVNRSPA